MTEEDEGKPAQGAGTEAAPTDGGGATAGRVPNESRSNPQLSRGDHAHTPAHRGTSIAVQMLRGSRAQPEEAQHSSAGQEAAPALPSWMATAPPHPAPQQPPQPQPPQPPPQQPVGGEAGQAALLLLAYEACRAKLAAEEARMHAAGSGTLPGARSLDPPRPAHHSGAAAGGQEWHEHAARRSFHHHQQQQEHLRQQRQQQEVGWRQLAADAPSPQQQAWSPSNLLTPWQPSLQRRTSIIEAAAGIIGEHPTLVTTGSPHSLPVEASTPGASPGQQAGASFPASSSRDAQADRPPRWPARKRSFAEMQSPPAQQLGAPPPTPFMAPAEQPQSAQPQPPPQQLRPTPQEPYAPEWRVYVPVPPQVRLAYRPDGSRELVPVEHSDSAKRQALWLAATEAAMAAGGGGGSADLPTPAAEDRVQGVQDSGSFSPVAALAAAGAAAGAAGRQAQLGQAIRGLGPGAMQAIHAAAMARLRSHYQRLYETEFLIRLLESSMPRQGIANARCAPGPAASVCACSCVHGQSSKPC